MFSFRDEDNNENDPIRKKKLKKMSSTKEVYRWRKKEPPVFNTTFLGDKFSLPERDEMTPLEYFKFFWDDRITPITI